jgi:hypothetical protein
MNQKWEKTMGKRGRGDTKDWSDARNFPNVLMS